MNTRALPIVAVLLALAARAPAADWPQWRGPQRTDVSTETGLLKAWPEKGPKLLWTYEEAGIGFSGPAIVGDRLYTMGGFDNKEVVFALDVKTGKKIWEAEVGGFYSNGWGDGPRGTPTVDGNLLYAIGAEGNLVCLDIAKGEKKWSVSLTGDLGGSVPDWGYTESPLIDGDWIVCTPGGGKGAIAALNKKDGKVVWQSKDFTEGAAYASIIVAEVGGIRQYVQMSPEGVFAVAAKNGKLLWRSSLGANSTAVVPTPIFHKNHVYVTSGYGSGCGLLSLTADGDTIKREQVYANKTMTNHHGGVVLVGDHVYGFSDRGGWVCQDFLSGKQVWNETRKLDKGSLTCVGDRLYCYGESDGECVLIEASPKAWTEHGRFKIPKETKIDRKRGKIWTHPVVANGRLYLRDQDLIFCYDVKDAK